MAKKSMVMRQKHREIAVKKYAKKRAELKELIRNPRTREEDKIAAQAVLQKMPRDANPVRLRNRCALTGRQVRFVAHEAARNDDARRDTGPHEGELVSLGRA